MEGCLRTNEYFVRWYQVLCSRSRGKWSLPMIDAIS